MKLLLSAALVGFCSLAAATETTTQYYVSPTGDDTNGDGSLTAPWQSINKAMNTIPYDQDDVEVNLREGTYILPSVLYITEERGGSENGVFTIKSYEGENAILDGSLIKDYSAMISIASAHYISLEGLELTNLTGHKSGIYVAGASSNINIYKNEIHGMHWTTDATAAASPSPSNNLSPIVIVGNSTDAMTNISILENEIYDLTTGYSEALKIAGNVDGFIIEGNTIYDVTNICIVAAGNYSWVNLDDASLNHARNGVISYNETYRCVSPIAASAGIYADGAKNILMSNNYSHHNTVGFSVGSEQDGDASGIVLTHNESANNTQAGLVIGTNNASAVVDGVIVTENNLHGNYTDAVYGGAPIVMNTAQNITIFDNDISSISQYIMTANAVVTNLSLNKNNYTSTAVNAESAFFTWAGISGENYTGFSNYKTATGQDSLSTFSLSSD